MTERASRLTLTRASAAHAGVRTRPQRVALFFSRVWAWAFLGLLVLFFVISVPLTTGGSVNFLTIRNSQNILVAIIPVLLLGLGQTFVIIAAGIDLSVGWVMSLASVLSALALRAAFNAGAPLFPSVLIGLIAALAGAAAVGLVNGVIIAKLKVPAFIVTLGTSFIVRGIAYLMSENTTVIGLPSGIRAYGNVTTRVADPDNAANRGALVLGNAVRAAATTQAVMDCFVVVAFLSAIALLFVVYRSAAPEAPDLLGSHCPRCTRRRAGDNHQRFRTVPFPGPGDGA